MGKGEHSNDYVSFLRSKKPSSFPELSVLMGISSFNAGAVTPAGLLNHRGH